MTTTMTVWLAVALMTAAALIARLSSAVRRRGHRLIEIGSEREEIWVPGDRLMSDVDDDDI